MDKNKPHRRTKDKNLFPKHAAVPSDKNFADVKCNTKLSTYTDEGLVQENYPEKTIGVNAQTKSNSDVSKSFPNQPESEEFYNALDVKCVENRNENRLASDRSGVRSKHEIVNSVYKPNTYQQKKALPLKFDRKNDSDSDNEYSDASLDFYKPVPHSGYRGRQISLQSSNQERMKTKENFFFSINQYKKSKAAFSNLYCRWLPQRRSTLEKLRSLYIEVHEDAMNYNKAQAGCKQLSFTSRAVKQNVENPTVDFFASLTAFFSDAVSGVASFAEACKIDSYKDQFKEIMDCDAKITKELYTVRSQCVEKYWGIEEVMKNVHSNTMISTVSKISNTLEVDKHWEAMKNAYQNDDMPRLFDAVYNFFGNTCQSKKLSQVGDSLQKYVDDNPAALDACKSTGKAVYGAINTFGENKNQTRNNLIGNANSAANFYLMIEDKKELDHLNRVINEDTYQSKLESQIEEAIDSLESEMKEINDIYSQLFNYKK